MHEAAYSQHSLMPQGLIIQLIEFACELQVGFDKQFQ